MPPRRAPQTREKSLDAVRTNAELPPTCADGTARRRSGARANPTRRVVCWIRTACSGGGRHCGGRHRIRPGRWRARPLGPAERQRMAGPIHAEPVTLGWHERGRAREPRARATGALRRVRHDESGTMVFWLVDTIPTVENGGASEDLTSVTWTLKEGLESSDALRSRPRCGLTWEYCTHPEVGCAQIAYFEGVENVEGSTTAPHGVLQPEAVGQALSMAIDRQLLVEIGDGAGGQPICNVLPAPELYASTANGACLVQGMEGAKALLEEAGLGRYRWRRRSREGRPGAQRGLPDLDERRPPGYPSAGRAVVKRAGSRDRAARRRRVLRRRSGQPGHVPEVLRRYRDVHQQLRGRGPRSGHGELDLRCDPDARHAVAGREHPATASFGPETGIFVLIVVAIGVTSWMPRTCIAATFRR